METRYNNLISYYISYQILDAYQYPMHIIIISNKKYLQKSLHFILQLQVC